MSNHRHKRELGPIHQGAYTSHARDKYGADTSSPITLLSGANEGHVRSALMDYKNAGANQFGAATFGSSPYRASNDASDWQCNTQIPTTLPEEYERINRTGVRISAEIAGKPVPALISPVTDTIGRHDEHWKSLGSNQKNWALARHAPQVQQLLTDENVTGIWVEALRYLKEAEALAELSRKYRAKLLVVSFRLEDNGDFPDQEHSDLSIRSVRQILQETARDTKVITGINCTGVTAILNRLGDAGDSAGVVYPNTNDYARGSPGDAHRLETLYKKGRSRTSEEKDELTQIVTRLHTTRQQFEAAWRLARDRDPSCVISACCGATPEIVQWAYDFHSNHKSHA